MSHKYIIILYFALLCNTLVAQEKSDSVRVVNLNDVIVISDNIYRQDDHINVIPTVSQKEHAQSGYSLLSNLMIPGLTINKDGSVVTLGFNTGIYINGQPATKDDVTHINPKDVSKIEIFDDTSGKYARDNIALNFVVKRYNYGGYTHLSAEQSLGINSGAYRVTSSISRGAMIYSLFGGIQYSNINNVKFNASEKYITEDDTIFRDASSSQNVNSRSGYAQMQVQYRKNKKYFVGKISFIGNAQPKILENGYIRYGEILSEPNSTMSSNKSYSPRIDLNGEITFGKNNNINWGLHGIYAKSNYQRIYDELPYQYISKSSEGSGQIRAGLIYTKKIFKGTFTAETFNYFDVFNTIYTGTFNKREKLWENEALIFTSLKYPLGDSFSFQTRLGLDWYQYKLNESYKYNNLYPRVSFKLTRQLKKGLLLWNFMLANFNYNNDIINDAIINVNPYLFRQGNPMLKKSYSAETYIYYSLSLKKINLSTNIQYQYYKNPVSYRYFQCEDKILQTFCNDGEDHVFMSNIALTYKLNNFLVMSGNMKYCFTRVNSNSDYINNSFSCNVALQYIIKNFFIVPSLEYTSSVLNRYTHSIDKVPLNYNFKVSYSYRNFMVSINAHSPFNKRKFKSVLNTEYYSYNKSMLNPRLYRYCDLSISYLIDYGKKVKRIKSDINNTINSAILKAN